MMRFMDQHGPRDSCNHLGPPARLSHCTACTHTTLQVGVVAELTDVGEQFSPVSPPNPNALRASLDIKVIEQA